MIDRGLLVGLVLVGATTWAAGIWWCRRGGPDDAVDRLGVASLIGLAAGRIVFLLFEDSSAITTFRDLLVIRGGVEFWAGMAAGVAAAVVSARRRARVTTSALAEFCPLFLVGYGVYELTCVVRDGCFGPALGFGLVPSGFATRMLPLGLMVGVASVLVGFVLMSTWSRWTPVDVLIGTALVLAGFRSLASLWLPRIGPGLSRPHRFSLLVFGLALAALVWRTGSARRSRSTGGPAAG